MPKTKEQEARAALTKAQQDEAAAQERGNPVAILEARGRAAEAANALYSAQQPEPEPTVTLASPNPEVNVVDSNGLRFENGVARGVPKSLAETDVREFPGYEIRKD